MIIQYGGLLPAPVYFNRSMMGTINARRHGGRETGYYYEDNDGNTGPVLPSVDAVKRYLQDGCPLCKMTTHDHVCEVTE